MDAPCIVLSTNNLSTAQLLRSGPTIVTAVEAFNTTAAAAYIQMFDAAAIADVTLGTTLPLWVVKSPASDVSNPDNPLPQRGVVFQKGVVVASTTTPTGLATAVQHLRTAIA